LAMGSITLKVKGNKKLRCGGGRWGREKAAGRPLGAERGMRVSREDKKKEQQSRAQNRGIVRSDEG